MHRARRQRAGAVLVLALAAVMGGCDRSSQPADVSSAATTTAEPVGTMSPRSEPGTIAPPSAPIRRDGSAELADRHPLDGLSVDELEQLRSIVEQSGRVDMERAVFPVVELLEPSKAEVLAWRPGDALVRRAHVVVADGGSVSDATVNVTSGRIEEWEPAASNRYPFVANDFAESIGDATADPRFVNGLSRRGLSIGDVTCLGFGPGQPRLAAEEGRRLVRIGCYVAGENFWSRPVEGLVATYDLDGDVVTEVIDSEPVPIPTDIDPSPQAAIAAPRISPPDSIEVNGAGIRWGDWQFRWRMDRRAGLVLNDVVRRDTVTGTETPVMYQAYLSEMYVPYHDPDPAWAWRAFMDSGEFGLGTYLSPLVSGLDCPPDARFLTAVVPTDSGRGRSIDDAVCLIERESATPSRRHDEGGAGATGATGDAGVELVVRAVSTVGNYDYTIDYVFDRVGGMRVDVAAAGVVLQKATASTTFDEHVAAGDAAHGTLLAPHLVGVNHDHFLNFRLDLDVAGASNRFVRDRLQREQVDNDPARTSIWATATETVAVEGAVDSADPTAERWLFQASGPLTPGGQRPAYLLDPGNAIALPIADPLDPGLRRAAWSTAALWVTPNDPDERFAGGSFVLGSTGDDGLAVWAEQNRPLDGQDLVAWFNVGFHHVVRAEDVPSMPTHQASFELRPENFPLA